MYRIIGDGTVIHYAFNVVFGNQTFAVTKLA